MRKSTRSILQELSDLGVSKNKDLINIYYHLGLVYFITRDLKKSISYFTLYLENTADKKDDWRLMSAFFMLCYDLMVNKQENEINPIFKKFILLMTD